MTFETGSYTRSLNPKGNGGLSIHLGELCNLKPISFDVKDTSSAQASLDSHKFNTGLVVTFSEEIRKGTDIILPSSKVAELEQKSVNLKVGKECNVVLLIEDNKKVAWIKPKTEDTDIEKVGKAIK